MKEKDPEERQNTIIGICISAIIIGVIILLINLIVEEGAVGVAIAAFIVFFIIGLISNIK